MQFTTDPQADSLGQQQSYEQKSADMQAFMGNSQGQTLEE